MARALVCFLRNPPSTAGGNPRYDAASGTVDAETDPFRMGAALVATSGNPNGTKLYDIAIYDRALLEIEIRAE